MNIFEHIIKREIQRKNGKLRITPSNWVFIPTQAQIERTLARNPHSIIVSTDDNGVEMLLIRQRGVMCPSSELCSGKYPYNKKYHCWFLPLHVCRKCEYHRKGKKRGTPRYPCCGYMASDNPNADAVADTISLIGKAVKTANELIGI